MRRLLLPAACLLVTLAAAVHASVFVELTVEQLIHHADRGVVIGRVLSVDSRWNADRSMIFSYAKVVVREDLAGRNATGEELIFRVPGGRVGPVTVTTIGAPEFEPGDEVLVFAAAWSDGALKVLGYEQGLSRLGQQPGPSVALVGGRAGGWTIPRLRAAIRAERQRASSR